MLKLDLHIHSEYSEDAFGSVKEIKNILQKKGLNGMAITDHNSLKGGIKASSLSSKDFIIIPGVEISTKEGHMIGLNVSKEIPKGLTIQETVEKIIDNDGIPIVPHLFRNMSGIKENKLQSIINKINSIEVYNGCSHPKTNLKISKVAEKYNLGGTGGSDSHDPKYAGYAYTIIDTTDLSIDSIFSEINKKKTWGEGKTLPLSYRRDRMVKSVNQFFRRGFKRI
jgi:predicted metal-dependent phosphoesterase TrpH